MTSAERRPETLTYAPDRSSPRLWWLPVFLFQRHLVPKAFYGSLAAISLSIMMFAHALTGLLREGSLFGPALSFFGGLCTVALGLANGFRTLGPGRSMEEETCARSTRNEIGLIAQRDPSLVRCHSTGDHIQRRDEVDSWLCDNQRTSIRCVAADSRKRVDRVKELRREAELNREILWRAAANARNRKVRFVDEAKIYLLGDLECGTRSVEVSRGSYYRSFLLNERANRDYVVRGDEAGLPRSRAVDYFNGAVTDGNRRLLNNAELRSAPHIGANLLALGSDGCLVLWEQTSAMASNRHLAPTGSGSLDWSDLKRDLLSTVTRGAEREFAEESHRRGTRMAVPILETRVIGYFRWVDRACLPGFLLLSKLGCPSTDLVPNTSEVRRVRPEVDLPAGDARELEETIATLLSGMDQLPPLSTPLFALLLALERWVTDPNAKTEVATFLGADG